MIRHEFRPSNRADPHPAAGNRSAGKNKSRGRFEHSESNKENRSGHHQERGNTGGKRQSTFKGKLKENTPINQSTPKRNEVIKGISMEDVEQLSQIKFISKEFSSIRDKCNDDCVSFSNSGNNLDDFSPLFDKIERDNTGKEDFTLEICGIDDLDLLYDERKPLFENEGNGKIVGNSNGKTGRIKRNNLPRVMPIPPLAQQLPKFKLQKEILQIFISLDLHDKKILSKSNCASQRLSTELNYLIGSILNKIKVKSKEYDYKEFQTEFKRLIADSQHEEVMEILQNNIEKRRELLKNDHLTSTVQQHSPEFKKIKAKDEIVAQKLNKINSKLNFYLSKNNLDCFKTHTEVKEMPLPSDHKRQKGSFVVNKEQVHLKNSKTWDLKTQATQNSKVSCTQQSTVKSQVSLKNDVELIKRTDGSIFQLHFSELNKHLD